MLETENESDKPGNHEAAAYDIMVSEEKFDRWIPDPQNREFGQDKGTQCVVIYKEIDVPIDIFGHRDVDFLFLMPL